MRVRAAFILSLGLLLATAACTSAPQAGPATPAPSTATSPAPATTTATAPADLTLTASAIVTDGSVGIRKGVLTVTVRNNGSTAPVLKLVFTAIPAAVELNGSEWAACTRTSNGTSVAVTCPISSVPAGGQGVLTYDFANIDLGHPHDFGQVTVSAVNATEANTADNNAKLDICTNGCGG